MKLPLVLVVAMGLVGIGCGSEAEEESAPPPPEVTRVASSLERKLAAPIAIPANTAIGGTIDALIDARAELIPRSLPKLGVNGQRCTTVLYVDEQGAEQMRRDKCEKATDKLTVGKLLYADENGDGKIDQFSDAATRYDLFDTDHDGKVDRMVESAEHLQNKISLADFAPNVTITSGGTIATREREDKDHDGKFDVESVTATTAFRISGR